MPADPAGMSLPTVEASPAAGAQRSGLDEALLPGYVPSLVLDRLQVLGDGTHEAELRTLSGALLFADISGFTAMTERLATRGPAGIEQLVRRLNSYFGRLIEVLLDHGGDVLKFAGDALVVLFRERDDADLRHVVHAAASAALAAQTALVDQGEDAEGLILSLKIAVASGELSCAFVGGERGRWEMVVFGTPLLEAGAVANHCKAGSVVLTLAVRDQLGSPIQGFEVTPDVYQLEALGTTLPILPARVTPAETSPLSGLAAKRAWSFVPYAIRSRLEAGQGDWLAESRRLTVIFATLPGHTDAVDLARLQALMHQLQQLIYGVEGSVNKISVDDKGLSLISVLGMPPLSHEDDPRRGLMLALQMQALFLELGFRPSIGVATGRAFCGVIGSQRRREYTMIGDIVNLSARLMVASDGGLLCDQATHDGATEHFEFEERPALKLKGKAEPVAVWRPLKASHRKRGPGRELVGRDAELTHLTLVMEGLIDTASNGSAADSALWLIEAEAGVGKSSLLSEMGTVADQRGIKRLAGAADSLRQDSAYVAWREVLIGLLSQGAAEVTADDPVMILAALRNRLLDRPDLLDLLPVLNDVLPLNLPAGSGTAGLHGEGRAVALRSVVTALLAQETPLLLTLDDLQWLDSASWALLLGVINDVRPLLVVASTRQVGKNTGPTGWRELLARPGSGTLTLEGLAPAAVETLLQRRLGVPQVEARLVSFIAERSNGNPFHLEQLLLALKERDLLQASGDRVSVRPGVDLAGGHGIPDTIEGLITQRIDKLDPTAQLALKVASVVGRAFGERVVNAIFPVASLRGQLKPYLAMLAEHGLTHEGDGDPEELRYLFGQITTREVAYNLMLFSQRRALHLAVADWYESSFAQLEPYYAELAQHLIEAGAIERACVYLLRAGDQALARHACAESERLFRQALQLAEERPTLLSNAQRCHVLLCIGHASYLQGRIADAIAALRRGLELSSAPLPKGRLQLGLSLIAAIGVQWWRLRTGWRPGPPKQDREQHEDLVDAYRILSLSHYTRSERLEFLHTGLRALNLAEHLGPCAALAEAEATVSVIASVAGSGVLALTYARRVRAQLAELTDPARRGPVLFALSVHHSIRCDWAEAITLQTEAADLAESAQNWRLLQNALYGRSRCTMRLGDLATSYQLFERIEALGRRMNHGQAVIWGLSGQLSSPLGGKDDVRADQQQLLGGLLEAESAANRGHLSAIDYALGYGALAQSELWAGRLGEAEAMARRAGDYALSTDAVATHLTDPLAWAIEVHLACWEPQGGSPTQSEREVRLRALDRLLARYARKYPFARPILLRLRGEKLRRQDQVDKAQASLKAGLKYAEQRQMKVEVARCHAALAQTLQGTERTNALSDVRERYIALDLGAELPLLPRNE